MARANWWHMLQGSKKEALLAVDLYNRPGADRRLEAFVVHMQIAWTYLIHAKFQRDKTDYWYRDVTTKRRIRIDGDFKTWELAKCIKHVFPNQEHPVRRNVEFFIGFRNKIEHRYETVLESVVAGKCQSLIMNYERLLTGTFGTDESLADRLRFPVFLSSLSDEAVDALKETYKRLPRRLSSYVDEYDGMLADEVRSDYRYDFRVLLIPQTGPKTKADAVMRFVRLEELPEEQRGQLDEVRTIVRDREVPVSNFDRRRPGAVCAEVSETLGVRFMASSEHVRAWKYYRVRPNRGTANHKRTDSRYCVWDDAHDDYVYTAAWIRKLTTELADPERFLEVIGHHPVALSTLESDLAPTSATPDQVRPNTAAP